MAAVKNKILFGGNIKLLFSGRMSLYYGEIKIRWESFYWGRIFPGGEMSKFWASGRTPPILLVGKTLVDKSFLH